jgi:hypothetical protein
MYAEQKLTHLVALHMSQYGGNYQEWYVGVSADPKGSLFNDHGVIEAEDPWISRRCISNVAARTIERYFVKKGCKGGQADEDTSALYLYAYMIRPHTRQ